MVPKPRLPVRFTPAAADDLDEAFAYVTTRNRAAAAALLARIEQAVEHLGDLPEMGAPLTPEEFELVEPGVRFVVVEPYLVFYRVADPGVIVLRVLHAHRDSLGDLLGG
jgi:toxin ParE1/3/4